MWEGRNLEEGPEVDGQSAERFETTPARSKARTEPISMEKGSHGQAWSWRSTPNRVKIAQGEHNKSRCAKLIGLHVRNFGQLFNRKNVKIYHNDN